MSGELQYSTIARWPRFARFQRRAFGFTDGDHLPGMRTSELTPAGETTVPADLRQILADSLFSFCHCFGRMAGRPPLQRLRRAKEPVLQFIAMTMHHKRLMMHD